jgi:hypothetical protein
MPQSLEFPWVLCAFQQIILNKFRRTIAFSIGTTRYFVIYSKRNE